MRRNIFKWVAVVVAAMVGLSTAGAVANSYITKEATASNTVFSGCVLRFSDPDGWPSIHANGAHRCAGVTSVDINQYGEVRVWQTVDNPKTHPVLFAICQTDETLGGMRGITCGASGGTDNTRFRLYDTQLGRSLDLNKKADRMRVQGKNANLWVGWMHTKGWN